jgi:hypothetical protein
MSGALNLRLKSVHSTIGHDDAQTVGTRLDDHQALEKTKRHATTYVSVLLRNISFPSEGLSFPTLVGETRLDCLLRESNEC